MGGQKVDDLYINGDQRSIVLAEQGWMISLLGEKRWII